MGFTQVEFDRREANLAIADLSKVTSFSGFGFSILQGTPRWSSTAASPTWRSLTSFSSFGFSILQGSPRWSSTAERPSDRRSHQGDFLPQLRVQHPAERFGSLVLAWHGHPLYVAMAWHAIGRDIAAASAAVTKDIMKKLVLFLTCCSVKKACFSQHRLLSVFSCDTSNNHSMKIGNNK